MYASPVRATGRAEAEAGWAGRTDERRKRRGCATYVCMCACVYVCVCVSACVCVCIVFLLRSFPNRACL